MWSFNQTDGLSELQQGAWFGRYGGRYVAETLFQPLRELEQAMIDRLNDPNFRSELDWWMKNYVGRPNPLTRARRYSEHWGGAQIWLKREDLNHTGSHKINNTVGQGLLARHLGKKRIIAETGAGQHGVASATVAAAFGLRCTVYMGSEDTKRQRLNVDRMEQLGAEVVAVESGTATLKDALNQALREWVNDVEQSYYMIGTVAGPHPYPRLVRYFQSIIGHETRQQLQEQCGASPDALVACVGGGSNAIGMFAPFLSDPQVALYGVEAGGSGRDANAAPLNYGQAGVLHGNRSYVLMDQEGQIDATHSIAAGLDYPSVGPEHSALKDSGRVTYVTVDDQAALAGFQDLSRFEGIIPALETSHALAYAGQLAQTMDRQSHLVVCLSGRGDKDAWTISAAGQNQTTS